jgi:hypothetical protein
MLARMWGERNTWMLLMGMWIHSATVKNSM